MPSYGRSLLAAAVAASGSLARLWLAGNNIGDEGAKALSASVAVSGSMAALFLFGNNMNIGDAPDAAKQSLRDAVQGRQGFALYV